MSGIEIVGLLASIAQLAHYVQNIREFLQEIRIQVRSGSRSLEQRLDQLDRVLDTVREIEKNPSFHTPSIGRHLKAIVVQIESLQTVLGRPRTSKQQVTWRKFLNAYKEIRAEKQICIIFTKLEEEKSTLQLSMTEVHAKLSIRTISEQHPMATSEVQMVHSSRSASQDQADVTENGINATNDASAQVQEELEKIHEVDALQGIEPQRSHEASRRTELNHCGTGTISTNETQGSYSDIPFSSFFLNRVTKTMQRWN